MKVRVSKCHTKSAEELLIDAQSCGVDSRTSKRIEPLVSRDETNAGIYFVGAAGADLVKIGWVRRLDRIETRLNRLKIDCPYPVVLLFTVGPASREHEARVHKRFLAQHFHGEWFRYAGELAEFLIAAKKDAELAKSELRKSMDLTF